LVARERRIAGVDDAGRGPVIGPLIIAGAAFHEGQVELLKKLGVKDSKLLSAAKREKLAEEIKKLALSWHHVVLQPNEVDPYVYCTKRLFKLNYLEAKRMAEVIAFLVPDEVYVDASDVDEVRFGDQIMEHLPTKIPITSRHHADATYPVVSAASILAKVHRDSAIAELRQEFGDFGSGYPSDPKTEDFLLNWRREHGRYPEFARQSWKTLKRLDETIYQLKLD
jgi:ribonuclease HII